MKTLDIIVTDKDLRIVETEDKLLKALEEYFIGRPDKEADIFNLLDVILEHVDSETCFDALHGLHWQMDALVNK